MPIIIPEKINEYFKNLDEAHLPLEECEQVSNLMKVLGSSENFSPDEKKGIFADISAFEFQRADTEDRKVWGIYWTDHMSGTNENGTFHIPDITQVNSEVIEHWINRSISLKHPVLRARFADLAWEIGKYLNRNAKFGTKPAVNADPINIPHTLPQTAIDSYLESIKKDLYKDDYIVWKALNRGIQLAIGLNDKARVLLLKNEMFAYAKTHESIKSFMWWRLDDLTSEHAKALELTADENEEVKSMLMRVLNKTSDKSIPESFNPHDAQSAAQRLAKRLLLSKDEKATREIIKRGCEAFEVAAESAGGMVAISWLQDLIPIYRANGMPEEAIRVEHLIRSRSADAQSEMKSYGVSVKIDKKEMDEWVEIILGNSKKEALEQIAFRFLIQEDATKRSVLITTKDAPLSAMMGSSIINNDGFTIAKIGSVDKDMEGRSIQHASTIIKLNSVWLFNAYQGVKNKYGLNEDDILEFIRPCGLFRSDREPLIRNGISAWLNDDASKCIHILVPQIEAALRNLLSDMGGAVMEADPKTGWYQSIGFGKIINNPIFRSKTPHDLFFHLKALYSDARGINLRNDIAHGLINPNILNMHTADWVIHTVLLIGIIQLSKTS